MRLHITRRWALRVLAGSFGAAIGVFGYLGFLNVTGNFHATIPGELYRSAQLQPGDLTRYTELYHIRSVLNLRGAEPERDWYKYEIHEATINGIEHRDFRMRADAELTDQEAVQLIETMRQMPKPLLIHCRSGADRTGLAAAFYLAAIAKRGEWASEEQLWLQNGHLPLWFTGAFAMNRTFERMEPYLGFPDS